MTVWFNEKAISNVFRYSLLTETRRFVVDSESHDSVFYCIDREGWIKFEK